MISVGLLLQSFFLNAEDKRAIVNEELPSYLATLRAEEATLFTSQEGPPSESAGSRLGNPQQAAADEESKHSSLQEQTSSAQLEQSVNQLDGQSGPFERQNSVPSLA